MVTPTDVRLVPITTADVDRATQIRAACHFETVDSPHLAATGDAGCDLFRTNDARPSAVIDVPV